MRLRADNPLLRGKEVQRYYRVYGCSKGHISLVIEIVLKEEFIVGLLQASLKLDKKQRVE